MALSQRVFDDVVASEYATLPSSRLVLRPVQVKEFTGTVYVYVPEPSGALLRDGFGDGDDGDDRHHDGPKQTGRARRNARPAPVVNRMSDVNSATAIQVGHLHGGIHGMPDD